MQLNPNNIDDIYFAVETVRDYLSDNGCGDPECCGEPLVSHEAYEEALDTLLMYGIDSRF